MVLLSNCLLNLWWTQQQQQRQQQQPVFSSCLSLTSGSALPGGRLWPAPPAGSSSTWTAPYSGWTRCSHKWAPRASAAPASPNLLHQPASHLWIRSHLWFSTHTTCEQTQRAHQCRIIPSRPFSQPLLPPPIRSTFKTPWLCNMGTRAVNQ